MAPEAFDGKRNIQTDIWSVGVILYQLLSGKLPFPQKTQIELIGALVRKESAPLPDSVPSILQYVVRQSLAKESSKRYQTADEMREALRTALSPQKIVESQISSQAETLVSEDSDKPAKPVEALQNLQPLFVENITEAETILDKNFDETDFKHFLNKNKYIKSKKSKLWFRTIEGRTYAKVIMIIGFVSGIISAPMMFFYDSTDTFIGKSIGFLALMSTFLVPFGLYLNFTHWETYINFDSKTIKSDFLGYSNEREKFSSEQIKEGSLLMFESSKDLQIVFEFRDGYTPKKCLLYELENNSTTKNDLIETSEFFKFVFQKLGIKISEITYKTGQWN